MLIRKGKSIFNSFESVNQISEVKTYINQAINLFSNTTLYGSPDYGIPFMIKTITKFLSKVFSLYEIKSLGDMNKIKELWIKEYCYDNAIKLFQTHEVDNYIIGYIYFPKTNFYVRHAWGTKDKK